MRKYKKWLIMGSLIGFYIYAVTVVGFMTTLSLFVTWSIMSVVFRGHLELFSLFEKSISSIIKDITDVFNNKTKPILK